MRNWKKSVLCTVIVLGLLALAGCRRPEGSEEPQKDPEPAAQEPSAGQTPPASGGENEPETPAVPEVPDEAEVPENKTTPETTWTLEQVLAVNTVEEILKRHTDFIYRADFYEADPEAPVNSMAAFYTREDGFLQMRREYHDRFGGYAAYEQAYADRDTPGALYSLSSTGELSATFCAAEDYEVYLSGLWMAVAEPEGQLTQSEVLDTGTVVFEVRKEYQEAADLYDITKLTADAATGEILKWETASYHVGDDKQVGSSQFTVSYDMAFTPEAEPYAKIAGGTESCEVSVIISPEQEDMEVQWHPLAFGTRVYFYSDRSVSFYQDEALTEPVGPGELDTTGEAANLFVVYD